MSDDLTDTWPPRWKPGQPHFKKPIAGQVLRVIAKRQVDAKEDAQKAKARRRDKFCRFPLCGCTQMRIRLEVGHLQHKGMGGNPKGDRSKAEKLILMCAARHQDNSISVHHGNVRVQPLTKEGTAGPCAFVVNLQAIPYDLTTEPWKGIWFEVGRETSLHVFERFTPAQRRILKALGDMKL